MEIKEIKDFETLALFVECASDAVPKIGTLEKLIVLMGKMGYNRLYLGTADTYEIDGEPYFGYMRGRYTKDEINGLDSFAKSHGVELCGAVQTLAHLHFLPNYAPYKPIVDNTNILLAGDENTYKLIDKMFYAMSQFYSSRTVNIGMDEAFLLGAGKYLQKNGYVPRAEIMLTHLSRVLEIADKYGITCEMWSDMFFHMVSGGNYTTEIPDEIKAKIPKNVRLVYWNYLSTNEARTESVVKKHKELSQSVGYAGGLWKWIGFAPDNRFSIDTGMNAINACKKNNVKHFTLTMWADNGSEASLFSVLPSMYFYAQACKGKATSIDNLNKTDFKTLTGVDFDDFMLLDKLNKPIDKEYTFINNKSFIYLYSDVLYGSFDSQLSDNIGEAYMAVAEKLRAANGGEYGYLFKTLTALAKVLSIKAELAKRLRAAYVNGKKSALKQISDEDMPQLLTFLDELITAFTAQWMRENKAFAFEVHCIRLGGLRQRILYAKNTIDAFLAGEIKTIEELAVKQEPFGYESEGNEDTYILMTWSKIATHGFV